jgi:hypothetical protein
MEVSQRRKGVYHDTTNTGIYLSYIPNNFCPMYCSQYLTRMKEIFFSVTLLLQIKS